MYVVQNLTNTRILIPFLNIFNNQNVIVDVGVLKLIIVLLNIKFLIVMCFTTIKGEGRDWKDDDYK